MIALFTRVLLRLTVYYYYLTYASEAVVRRCSVKKAFLEILQNWQANACARASFLKKRLWHKCFPVNFTKFCEHLFLQKTSGGCFWCFRENLHSVILELLARKRRNISWTKAWTKSELKLHGNIIFLGEILASVNFFLLVSKY